MPSDRTRTARGPAPIAPIDVQLCDNSQPLGELRSAVTLIKAVGTGSPWPVSTKYERSKLPSGAPAGGLP